MGFAQGVAAGQRAGGYWDSAITTPGNPYSVMPSLKASLPTAIRDNAGALALKERELDLKEREIRLNELANAQKYEQMQTARNDRNETDRQNRLQTNAINTAKDAANYRQTNINNDLNARKQTALETNSNREYALKNNAQKDKESAAAQQNSYKMAKFGLATNNPGPIMDYFNTYGNNKANIDKIEFGPSGKDMLVNFSGQKKPVYFKDKSSFYKGLMAFADPTVQAAISKAQTKKTKTQNPYKVTEQQAFSEYDKRFKDETGTLVKDAPNRDTWANNFVKSHTEQANSSQKTQSASLINEQKAVNNSGQTLKTWSDGTKEILNKDGSVAYVKSPKGIVYKPNTIGYNRYKKTNEPTGINFSKSKKKKKKNHAKK